MRKIKKMLLLFILLLCTMSINNDNVKLSAYNAQHNKFEIAKDLRKMNISWENISGILSSIKKESYYNPVAFGGNCYSSSTVNGALRKGSSYGCPFGLFQLDGSRRYQMLSFYKKYHISLNNINEQLKYMLREYDFKYKTYPKIKNKSSTISGQQFARIYERCGGCGYGGREFYNRGLSAQKIYNELKSVFHFGNKQVKFGWHKGKYGRYWYGNYNYYYKGWHKIKNIWYWFYQDGYLYSQVRWDKFKSGRWGFNNGIYGYVTSKNKYIWSHYYKKMVIYKFTHNATWYK